MAAACSASVSRITAVPSTSSFGSSAKSSAVVSFGIRKLDLGCSSSQFYASETPSSFVVPNRLGRKSELVQVRSYKQNEELPPSSVSPRVKKPFVKPIKHGSHQKRMRRREQKLLPPKPLKAPANGMLVERLIPVAHSTYEAYLVLVDGVSRLLKHLPVKACRWCSEIHVGSAGHEIKTCYGKNNSGRSGEHLWVPGYLDDVVVPLEAFHLVDRMQLPIQHDERFKHERIPAIVELCIQAGLDLPEFPTVRRTTPIDMPASWLKHERDDSTGGVVDEEEDEQPRESVTERKTIATISDDDDLKTVAEKTLVAWEKMRGGAVNLMNVYPVRACGYCPEVHIGRRGHKLQLCGAFKHQWRNGQHGWQDAALDDLIPPRYVWHLRDKDAPRLKNKLAKLYGKAPAVVELCVQAGADIPARYKPRMRLDVIIPDDDELELVA